VGWGQRWKPIGVKVRSRYTDVFTERHAGEHGWRAAVGLCIRDAFGNSHFATLGSNDPTRNIDELIYHRTMPQKNGPTSLRRDVQQPAESSGGRESRRGRGGTIVDPWRISQVVLFKFFARTAERRDGFF
jgi:hypothetical protein